MVAQFHKPWIFDHVGLPLGGQKLGNSCSSISVKATFPSGVYGMKNKPKTKQLLPGGRRIAVRRFPYEHPMRIDSLPSPLSARLRLKKS